MNYRCPSDEVDRPSKTRAEGLVACALGVGSLALIGYGLVILQDVIVGQVADSHFTAWVHTVPLAAILSIVGLFISIRAIARSTGAVLPILGVILNGISLGVFAATFPGGG